MQISSRKYSEEYLHSVQTRFGEFKNHTTPQLIDVLEKNEDRRSLSKDYESQVDHALHEIEQEVVLDGDDELLEYIFGDMSHKYSDKIQSGITYVIQHGGRGDLVLGSRLKEPIQGIGPDTKIGFASNLDRFHFVFPKNFEFTDEKKIKMILLLSVNDTGKDDTVGRKEYKLVPQLLEVSSKDLALLPGMLYKKYLNPNEFKDCFMKIE